MEPDDLTLGWLDKAKSLSSNLWLQLWHTVAKTFLKMFMSQTDVNGMLKRGSMFILSEKQFHKLLSAGGFELSKFLTSHNSHNVIDILDIGAGDGEITTNILNSVMSLSQKQGAAHIQPRVYTTESSWTMRNRLEKLKFNVVEEIKQVVNVPLIACLNVLDRCIDPHEILQDMYNALAPDGRVLIALVLPYSHYCEFNTSHMPLRPLMDHWPDKARQFSFEAETVVFFEMLERMGFRVESWTKAPYLCEGDLHQSFYWLVDLVVVLSKQ